MDQISMNAMIILNNYSSIGLKKNWCAGQMQNPSDTFFMDFLIVHS